MFHSNTQRLIDYWRAKKVGPESPARSAVDPMELATLLPQVFMLGRLAPGKHVFRLAGGLVGDLHRRDLRGADFLELWSPEDRLRLASSLESSRKRAEPFVALTKGSALVGMCNLEILLAPLRSKVGEPERTLGLYQPTSPLAALASQAVTQLDLIRLCTAEGDAALPSLRLAAVEGRLIA
ncbi:MAG: PAS domain-containing protein [Caulobacteraceae bacterium]